MPDVVQFAPDGVTRFALGQEPCPDSITTGGVPLGYDKIVNAGQADLVATPANGIVDYAEARASLGLHESHDFRFETRPLLQDARSVLESGYTNPLQRVAYVGAYGSFTDPVTVVCGQTDGPLAVEVWIEVTNHGETPLAVQVDYSIPLSRRVVEATQHTAPILPDATGRVELRIPKTNDWTWAGEPEIELQVSDAFALLDTCSASLASVSMSAATANPLYNAHAESLVNLLAHGRVDAKIFYEAYNGRGNPVPVDGTLQILDSLGLPLATDSKLHHRGWESFTLSLPDAYQVALRSPAGDLRAQDILNVVLEAPPAPGPLGGLLLDPAPPVVEEAAYLHRLLPNFLPDVYDEAYATLNVPFGAGGDVYPDIRAALNEGLAPRLVDDQGTPAPSDDEPTLLEYNVVVIGSDVDANALTPAGFKDAVRDWVYAGGLLIVLGSSDVGPHWLEPLFDGGLGDASGPISVPDPEHPLLLWPHEVAAATYGHHGLAWEYGSAEDAARFDHVVTLGDDDLTALSKNGAFGRGRVLLSAHQPFDLGDHTGAACEPATLGPDCAGLRLLHNYLTVGLHELYVQYGPTIPAGAIAGASSRIAQVYHPGLAVVVDIEFILYVF